jgi:predicted nucleotidyltransferase
VTALERLREALDSRSEVQLAVLFGSAARGAVGASSDIDVGVIVEPASGLAAASLTATLARATGRPVDVIDLRTAPPLLRFEIARDGEVVFERSPALWCEFRAQAMIDWWDWAPTARAIHRAAAARLRRQVGDGSA